jgi:hypothetical protein
MLQDRQIELTQYYITKTVNTTINTLIIEKIAQQQEIDQLYNNKSEKTKNMFRLHQILIKLLMNFLYLYINKNQNILYNIFSNSLIL